MLVVITARKVINRQVHENRQKRGRGAVLGESALLPGSDADKTPAMQEVIGPEPTPEFAAQVSEECELLLARLESPELRQVAVWKMEGYRNEEIAGKLDSVVRTVERRLRRIRSIWSQDEPA